MNMLTKTKKYFPRPVKDTTTGNWTRHPSFQAFLSSWNILLASTTEEAYYTSLENLRAKFPQGAASYYKITSPIEGYHATLKLYLQRGHTDLRGVFLKLQLFWNAQYSGISSTIAQ
ncbi:uncharacterized protein RAG0_03142 [Rhynchosporium agropyri]|uniref:Mutator family transposase n=2 Tax=Rhynchosporium TaxID=38037 RepID=A0A1E1MWJ0_RHYSE|nr:uncharacterized protein RAG0_03142 [Rhynchosporium agropyri]CZT53442.1 uncharacterized protein RSE6_15011 [Rhynchosporium secalis]